MSAAREKWRETVAEACAGFRLDCVGRDNAARGEQRALVTAGIAEILRLRLIQAYLPLFRALDDLEKSYARLGRREEEQK